MSEDDATALEQEAEAQLAAEREAFEARFPPEAFTGIAKALKVRPTPENLAWLRDELLPDFYSLYFSRNQVKRPTRKEEIDLWKKIHKAASDLHSAVTIFNINCLPLDLFAPAEGAAGVTDHFIATLRLLADSAPGQIETIASEKSRRGRPAKNAPFRGLTPLLIRMYKFIREEPAECPYYLPDSGVYSGKGSFYPFARAVWCCLRQKLPADARDAIPSTEPALAQELRKHWPQDRPKR